jgi:hypothetical protein
LENHWPVYRSASALSALLYSLTASGLLWSNSVMAGYPSAPAKDDAAPRLILARSATNPRPYPTCTSVRPVHLAAIILSLNSTGTLTTPHNAADTRYTIVQGIQNWLLSGSINDPASTDLIVQIGWLQVLKYCIPHKWNELQESFFRCQGYSSKYNTGEQRTKQLIALFCTHSHIGVQPHTHLETAAQTTLALALDRSHNSEWKRHTHTVQLC